MVMDGLQIGLAWSGAERLSTFEELMVRHERMVVRVAARMMGRVEDGQDIAQEVFLRLFKHLDQIEVERGVESWLYRTTMNACFDALRRRRPVEAIEFEPPVEASQQADLEREERRQLMAEGLKTLPEKERAALVLREIEGLETAEVAAILGSSEVTVRSQVSMGKAKLKAFVERRSR